MAGVPMAPDVESSLGPAPVFGYSLGMVVVVQPESQL